MPKLDSYACVATKLCATRALMVFLETPHSYKVLRTCSNFGISFPPLILKSDNFMFDIFSELQSVRRFPMFSSYCSYTPNILTKTV